jgi:2-octaprenyl-6-methoxyphenol hydroxylase
VAGEEAEEVAALDDAAWIERIQRVFGWRVGRFLATGERSVYPIVQVVAERTVAARAVLLGNAAQTIHPVGAQGFNLGLRDALTLAELIEQAQDPGVPALLDRYEERRREDRRRTLEFSDGLARITGNASPLARPLRSLGLIAADNSPALQSMLVGGAMGFRGEVPELCR